MAYVKTAGEYLFAAYLRQCRLSWEYEREVNGHHPDFWIDHPGGTVIAEVYEPELRLPPGGVWFESYTALRRTFEARKAKQIKAVKEVGLPYLAVVASTNADLPIQPLIMAGAMFGNLATTFRIGADPIGTQSGRTIFHGGARLQSGQHRGVSAVAVLERFNPTKWRIDTAMADRLTVVPVGSAHMTARDIAAAQRAIVRIATDTEDQLLASGAYDPEARLARVTVLHNPHALHPLDVERFNEPHDIHWGEIEVGDDLGYGQLSMAVAHVT